MKKELRILNHTRAVRVWVPECETVHGLWNNVRSEVDGLVLRDNDGRNFRVDRPSKEVQEKLLRFNGILVTDIPIKVTTPETSCTVAEICEKIDEPVDKMDE